MFWNTFMFSKKVNVSVSIHIIFKKFLNVFYKYHELWIINIYFFKSEKKMVKLIKILLYKNWIMLMRLFFSF